MTETKSVTCIICPKGCRMTVCIADGAAGKITGHGCKRGEAYGAQEAVNPMRSLTTTVRLTGGELAVMPVKTTGMLKKSKILEAMRIIGDIEVAAPVNAGDIVIKRIFDTEIDVVSTKSIGKCQNNAI